MILVVGLVVAGLVGIAAAFYFSIRSGHGGSKRLRSGGSGRAGGDRRQGSRSHGAARPDRTDNGRRAANGSGSANGGRAANTPTRNYRAEDSTGPNPVLDFEAHGAEGGDRAARPRRRVGFRKGTDVDEELWPTETFGGVSDEQFWDDLASDKPLTTTARTAHQDPGTRNRPFAAVPRTATQPVQKMPSAQKMPPGPEDAACPEDAARASNAADPEQAGAGADRDPACPGRRRHQPTDECRQPAVAGR